MAAARTAGRFAAAFRLQTGEGRRQDRRCKFLRAGKEWKRMMDVTRNAAARRFELAVEGHTAFIDYREDGDRMVLVHTEVPQALGGRGIGTRLARGALDLARQEGRRLELRCDFLQGFVERNPEYRDLLA